MIQQQNSAGQFTVNEQFHETNHNGGIQPPRFIVWFVVAVFLLGVVGVVSGIVIFREALEPRYQERIIGILPFMSVFRSLPESGTTLPTAEPLEDGDISPEDLLSGPLAIPSTETQTDTNVESGAAPEATDTSTPTEQSTTEQQEALPERGAVDVVNAAINQINIPAVDNAAISNPATDAVNSAAQVAAPVTVAQANTSADVDPSLSFAAEPHVAVPSSARMFGFTHVQQTWNNCGPANITMALSYYGWQDTQNFAASFLKPDAEDKNVSPHEMINFVNTQTQVRAVARVGGDIEMIKRFVANNIPVIVETGYMPEGYDWLGHYQTVVGYDDTTGNFFLYDSFLGSGENGEGITESYPLLDSNWQAFNRTFMVVYQPEDEGLVREILGDLADPTVAAEIALETAQREAREDRQNGFAWFNIGSSLNALGRYEEAAAAFDQARRVGLPWRMLWYQFGPFETYYNVGRYDDVMSLVNVNLNNGGEYVEETHYWQGMVYQELGQQAQAASSFRRALAHNPLYADAQTALANLNA
ncbi:MAG: tetratricopeptide repeat protein [Chloroflexi bacterium]|nr:MAG: hypothetical protein CUN54_06730 [Phototrophicales bacterium]RMF76926.1 MAG: tetratricopeptide repeat protein [Chloroflexota bacterium]